VIGFEAPKLEIQGYAAIEARVARAHEDFVASGQLFFRARDNAVQLRNLVKFNWEMVATATGAVDGFGSRCSSWMTDTASRSTTSSSSLEPTCSAVVVHGGVHRDRRRRWTRRQWPGTTNGEALVGRVGAT
jgi:hypothetical protein